MAKRVAWVLTLYVDGERSHISSHNARRHAEFQFKRLTNFSWRAFERGEKATEKFLGSTIKKVERGVKKAS
ncbi:MAG: hypothetical protein KGI26_04760 [Thaumarchaeota archaeon]|nr:hypothetical protein [Nitrososphaerota archaeon]